MTSKVMGKDAFLAAMSKPDIAMKDEEVPEFGGSVRVREMTGSIRNQLEAAYATIQNGGNTKALDAVTVKMLSVCVLDEDDKPFLTESDAKRLMASCPRVAFRLRDAVIDLSASTEDDVEALAEVFDDAQS